MVAALAAPALGDDWGPGVRFDLMPKGCRIHGVYGDGTATVDVYAGKKGRNHIVQTYDAGGLRRSTTYNAKGLMLRKDWAGGKWETFAPYSCFAVPGDCTYEYRNADGARKVFRGRVVPRGDGLVSGGGFAGEPAFNDTTLTLGPFNEIAAFREGSTRFRVTRYEGCGNPDGA
jgi:YD repeat-containing protein